MNSLRLYNLFTTVLPLVITTQFFALKYVTMKHKYIKLRAEMEPDYRNSKQYHRYRRIQKVIEVMALQE